MIPGAILGAVAAKPLPVRTRALTPPGRGWHVARPFFPTQNPLAVPQITVQDLSKTFRLAERQPGLLGAARALLAPAYRMVAALQHVSFSIARGELVGMIGPNGAGKSTLIKILCGILEPSSGACRVDGLVPWRDRIRHVARIGVVFGQRTQLWWDLPVADSFALLRDIYRVPERAFRATADRLIALLDIEHLLQQPVRQLSLGQRVRCDIAAAMLHAPEILFLDEPSIGLDATGKLALREHIRLLNRDEHVTVILATHDMHDIEALAQRILIIGNGRILRDGPFESIRGSAFGERRLIITLTEDADDLSMEGVAVVARSQRRLEVAFDPRLVPVRALLARIAADRRVADLTIEEPTIEELVARFYASHGAAKV
jgi:ABC-2 type transport system ATP-binding protein